MTNTADTPLGLPAELLEILACPNCHATPLAVDEERSELVCPSPSCGLAYAVTDQIPIMLIDQARAPQRMADAESPDADA